MGVEVGSTEAPYYEWFGRSLAQVLPSADVEILHIHIGQDTGGNDPIGGQAGGPKAVEELRLGSRTRIPTDDDPISLTLGKAQLNTRSDVIEIAADPVAQERCDLESFR
jgi:hypothetical protein